VFFLKSKRQSSGPPKGDLSGRDLCFIDIETTGSMIGFHEIIDIAAIRTSPDASRTIKTWQARIKPQFPERLSEAAVRFNGFDVKLWGGAQPSSRALWTEFTVFANDCLPVCHNPSFERAFISIAASQNGVNELGLDYHWIGTESLAWPLFQSGKLRQLSLQALCEFFGLKKEPSPHTALEGVKSCRDVYLSLMRMYELQILEPEVIQRAVR
jgi:DNA polymerase III alpha subunit (gram-positive type)